MTGYKVKELAGTQMATSEYKSPASLSWITEVFVFQIVF